MLLIYNLYIKLVFFINSNLFIKELNDLMNYAYENENEKVLEKIRETVPTFAG